MKINSKEIERRMDRFKAVCRKTGTKLTHQRIEIFREVAQSDEHPDAEKVFKSVRKRMPAVSLDTVYRALWLLKDLGLITTLGPSQERTRFDANLDRHHHFVCLQCGMTRDFYSDDFDNLSLPDSIKALGLIETTRVEVKGVCRKCAGKGKEAYTIN